VGCASVCVSFHACVVSPPHQLTEAMPWWGFCVSTSCLWGLCVAGQSGCERCERNLVLLEALEETQGQTGRRTDATRPHTTD